MTPLISTIQGNGRAQNRSRRKMEDDERLKKKALEKIEALQLQNQTLPRLVVFDLDYTLWPFYCEFYSKSDKPRLYKEAKGILYALKEGGIDVAIASRTPTPDVAQEFLNNLGLQSLFLAQEIYPSWTHKTEHFERMHNKTGIPYNSMLFFDDENRNIEAVSKMGVTCVLVDGMDIQALEKGLSEFSHKWGSQSRS